MTTVLLVISLALNLAAAAVLLIQRARQVRFAGRACANCPFVVNRPAPAPLDVLPYDEPTTMFR